MVVASPSFVVALANNFSDFGAMFSLLAPRSDVSAAGFKEGRKENL
jgi:hypothetical protein